MSNKMLFLSAVVNSFNDATPDPFYARYLATFNEQQRYTTTFAQVKTYFLNTSDTASVTANSTWRIVAIKVIGEIELSSTGVDPAPVSISGKTRAYGINIFPGWIIWSTNALTTNLTITALTDDTIVEVFNATLEADA